MPGAGTITHPEIREEDADAKLQSLYDDIKRTFRVPFVSSVFRVLAAQCPDYLLVAWRGLKPNVRTVYFEIQSDNLRAMSVQAMAPLSSHLSQDPEPDLANVLRVFHYLDPKVLLAVTALRSATMGQQPKLQELSGEDKRQVPQEIASGAKAVSLSSLSADESAQDAVFTEIDDAFHSRLISLDYRSLTPWPDLLASTWSEIQRLQAVADYRKLQSDLSRLSQQAVASLPFRMDLNPHTLRHCGLSEQGIDDVRSTLDAYFRFLPAVVAHSSFLASQSFGREEAARSPFPITTV
ncbi:MAG: hypothetical protein NVSMB22_06920 [Chloroflexota bacterium]